MTFARTAFVHPEASGIDCLDGTKYRAFEINDNND